MEIMAADPVFECSSLWKIFGARAVLERGFGKDQVRED
jgi:hypothetical protein